MSDDKVTIEFTREEAMSLLIKLTKALASTVAMSGGLPTVEAQVVIDHDGLIKC